MQPRQKSIALGPPKPRLVFRFGISGHRLLGKGDKARLHEGLVTLFCEARETFDHLSASHRDLFTGTGAELRLITPLAEGADRVTAEAALANDFTLDCPLPFARDLYEKDFESEASRKTFRNLLGRARNVFELEDVRGVDDNRAYESVGLMTLRQCDILIAIWNGKPAEGRGGTAEIVGHAIASNIPVIWFHSEDDVPPKLLRTKPMASNELSQIPSEELSADGFDSLLRAMVLPPPDPQRPVSRPPSKRVADYWRERQVRFTLTVFYAFLQGLVFIRRPRRSDFRVPDYLVTAGLQWLPYWKALPPISQTARERLETILAPAVGWADGLASYYVRVYRSSYVVSFLLASAAVFVSLMGLWDIVPHWVLFLIELLLMVIVIMVVALGLISGWHDRWIDYRHLAELLRQMRVLTLTGSNGVEIHEAAHTGEAASDSGAAWVGWYYRAIIRDVGMVGANVDAVYAKTVARLVRETELSEQIQYHRATATVAHKMDRRLDLAGRTLFALTALICLGFLIAWWFGNETHPEVEIFLTSLLPAFGAALYGIRIQGEFARVSHRAHYMDEQLSQIDKVFEVEMAAGTLTLARVSALTEMAAHSMSLDVTDWRFVFREKPLTLPA